LRIFGCVLVSAMSLCALLRGAPADTLIVRGISGRPGGTLVYAQRAEPKSLNPLISADAASREVIQRFTADLIHINRLTQQTEPALAKSWTVSRDGLHYTIELRHGLRFSDGHPFDADDVVFSFQAYLDERVHSPQRDLLLIEGKPIAVRKLDAYRIALDLVAPYAAAERLFDGFAMLPRHLLWQAYQDGKLGDAWGLHTRASEIAGLGPFRFREYVAGQQLVLERNPYYWKADAAGTALPYLAAVDFTFAGSEDMQVARFQAGESDVISRISARNFAILEREQARRGITLADAGPGLEYSFLFFNLNELARGTPVAARQAFFRRESFRHAVSMAIDRDALVRLVYQGRAAALSTPVPVGDKAWVNGALPRPARSVAEARRLLADDGFSWSADGTLLDPAGTKVEFSIAVSAGNSDRVQMATLIQDDLKPLGIAAHVAPLEFRSLLTRVLETHDYDACLMSLSEGDTDPNTNVPLWLSSAANHVWQPEQRSPATPWEAEIDSLMRRQMTVLDRNERKRLFDRVQAIAMQHLPLIPLVSPDILVGARSALGGFRPATMEHYALWNIEELHWKASGPAR